MSTPQERWEALKKWLTDTIEDDNCLRQGYLTLKDQTGAASFGGRLSVSRAALAKMRELEAPQ